jgi:hypothetical protein
LPNVLQNSFRFTSESASPAQPQLKLPQTQPQPCQTHPKRKRKSSEVFSDVKLQAASSLAQLSRKKIKKAVKKVVVAEVRRVPSAFDDDMIVKPSRKGFFSCLCPDLRFDVRRHCTPGSENEFVDVETFSDDVAEVQKEVMTPVAVVVVAEVVDPQPSGPQDEASQIHQGVGDDCSQG